VSDLPWVAIGFGLMPLGGLLLYGFRDRILAHANVAWGFLVGAIAFIGIGHSTAAVLEANAFLKYALTGLGSAFVAIAGCLLGVGLFAVVLRLLGPGAGRGDRWILPAAVAYLGLHSFSDGYVLGQSYAGVGAPGIELLPIPIAGTVIHRFVEGMIVVVPALELAWRPSRTGGLLLAALLSVPAAFVAPEVFLAGVGPATQTALYYGITVFASAAEMGFALLFLIVGILPRLMPFGSQRWAAWAALGLLLMLLVHFTVE
jgi:hypothetical protein